MAIGPPCPRPPPFAAKAATLIRLDKEGGGEMRTEFAARSVRSLGVELYPVRDALYYLVRGGEEEEVAEE